jgi:hypothetical protein
LLLKLRFYTFSVAIINYLKLGNIQREKGCLLHSFGGLRVWHCLDFDENLIADGIMVEAQRRAKLPGEAGSHSLRKGQTFSFILIALKRTNCDHNMCYLNPFWRQDPQWPCDLPLGTPLKEVPPPLNIATLKTKFPTREPLGDAPESFPNIATTLPVVFVKAAKAEKINTETFYCNISRKLNSAHLVDSQTNHKFT